MGASVTLITLWNGYSSSKLGDMHSMYASMPSGLHGRISNLLVAGSTTRPMPTFHRRLLICQVWNSSAHLSVGFIHLISSRTERWSPCRELVFPPNFRNPDASKRYQVHFIYPPRAPFSVGTSCARRPTYCPWSWHYPSQLRLDHVGRTPGSRSIFRSP